MKQYNSSFTSVALRRAKSPRVVIEIAWDLANAEKDYLTTHHDAAVPEGANAIYGVIQNISSTSQQVYPLEGRATIGDMTFSVIDRGGAVTELFNARQAEGYGMRARRVRVYMGWEGLPWSQYELVQTQIISSDVTFHRGVYTIRTGDVQRTAREEIFVERHTRLTQSIGQDDTTITVADATVLSQVEHGTSYQDAPPYSAGTITTTNGSAAVTGSGTAWLGRALEGGRIVIGGQSYIVASVNSNTSITLATPFTGTTGGGKTYTIYPKVGYIRIGDEIICYPAGGIQGNELRFCVRGRFRTRAVAHNVPDGVTELERLPRVDEIVYLEMPPPKLALAILTGDLWGQPGQKLPDTWHLSIDPTYIRTADFTSIGADIWDPNDDTQGLSLQFIAERQVDGKKFIEDQLNRAYGAYCPVYRDGSLGLRRITPILPGAAYVVDIDETVIVDHQALRHDQSAIRNQFRIRWNHDPIERQLTRETILTDGASVERHRRVETYEMDLRGLSGTRHTQNTLSWLFDTLRSRHAGAPVKIRVKVRGGVGIHLEVGDVVRLKHAGIRDYQGDVVGIDRSMEVQQVTTDWRTGDVWIELFGATERATPIAPTVDAGAGDDVLTSTGTNLVSYLAANYPGAYQLIGQVGHITANITLPGASTTGGAIYYHDGDLDIDAGVRVTITQNVQIRVAGFFNVFGVIDGAGRGLAGSVSGPGAPGYVGINEGMGGISDAGSDGGGYRRLQATRGPATRGRYESVPSLLIRIEDGDIVGIPSDLRGSSGASSGLLDDGAGQQVRAAGGAGGAGLVTVSRGMGVGTVGSIDLSGGAGATAMLSYQDSPTYAGQIGLNLHAAGAGGSPGVWLCLIEGAASQAPVGGLVAKPGAISAPGAQMTDVSDVGGRGSALTRRGLGMNVRSYYPGHSGPDQSRDNFIVQYLPAPTEPVPDMDPQAPRPLSITVQEHKNTPQTPNQNLCTLEVSVTPPSGAPNYLYSNIYYRRVGQSGFLPAGPATPEAVIVVPMDGTAYEIIARPVSVFHVESPDYVSTVFVTSTEAGGVVLGPGNYIKTGEQVGGTILGNGVLITEEGVIAFNSSGQPKVIIDAEDGTIYAEDGIFSGMVIAEEGVIGGWDIGEDSIVSPGGAIVLDAAGERITVGSKVVLDGSGSGSVTLAAGQIGGWNISDTAITKGNISLDSANQRIQVGPSGSTYVRISADGILGVDSTLGTTFRLPTDGSPPEFASGIIKKTVFEIQESAVLRTSPTVGNPSSGQGVLINNTGVKGYASNGALQFHLDATTGTVTANNAVISGAITATGGAVKSALDDLEDAIDALGELAYEDLVEAGMLGTTIIQGGLIRADLLSASRIITGTLDASLVNVTNLNADNITAGTITGRRYRTSASGERIEINAPSASNRILWHDSGGAERIRIGTVSEGLDFYLAKFDAPSSIGGLWVKSADGIAITARGGDPGGAIATEGITSSRVNASAAMLGGGKAGEAAAVNIFSAGANTPHIQFFTSAGNPPSVTAPFAGALAWAGGASLWICNGSNWYRFANNSLGFGTLSTYAWVVHVSGTGLTAGTVYAGSALRAVGLNANGLTQGSTVQLATPDSTPLTGAWRVMSYAPARSSWYSLGLAMKVSD